MRSDVGIGVVRLKKNADDLSATPTELFETGFKSAITDALKGCAGDLGRCFRPMLSEAMQNAITRGFFENEVALLRPLPDPDQTLDDNKRTLGRDDGDLVAASDQAQAHRPQRHHAEICRWVAGLRQRLGNRSVRFCSDRRMAASCQ